MMLTSDGPRVLEFNCRFGDPETQSILPRLRGDLAELLAAAAAGDLGGVSVGARPLAAVTVVRAASGYPDAPETGVPISGLDEAAATGALVFHAGTALADGRLVSAGGRVLDVTGSGETVAAARSAAYAAIERIEFPRCRWRRDIALDAVETGAGGPAAAPASARAAALRGER
jgi:phosphoribosylamine--glycine ligase